LFIVRKLEAQALSFKTEDLEITVEDQALQFTCDNTVSKVHDAGLGIFKDEISIDGEFSIKLGDQVSYDAYILKSLKKVYDPGCVRNILSGVITLNPAASSSDLSADFDPYQDEACDNLVRITINGKSTIYAY
jgi:hypothetical protein